MSDTYEPVTPAGVEDKPAATVEIHDSERILREMPPQDAREIFGEEITAEWSPEQAVEELRKQRSLQNSQPNKTIKFDFDGRRGEQTDKAAAGDLSFSRRVEHANRLLEAMPRLDAERAVNTANEALTGGHIHQFELNKEDRADPLSHGDDPKAAQQRLTAMREERAAALHALAEGLSQPAEAAPPVETQQQPERPPPPPVDPQLESERQRVQQEASALAALRGLSEQELQFAARAQELDRAATQLWGARVAAAGGFEAFAKQDPQAARHALEAKAAYDALNAQAQNQRQLREANEQILQHNRAAELAKVNAALHEKASEAFEAHVTQVDPQWNDANYRTTLQQIAKDIIEELRPGASAAIARGEVHANLGEQKAIYDAARARLMDQRIKESKESGRQKAMDSLPKVLRPGNGETRAEAAAHDFGARLRALPGIPSTEDAMREGARLLKARRGTR